MSEIADMLCEACPEAIVDFDITEGNRSVGLSFLSSGKYFLINNGPYYRSYDVPVPSGRDDNIFTYPGHARGWICRTPLNFDKWIPSVLFLTHYLPDDPQSSQLINLASLVLGQNGIWGDLLNVSKEGVKLFGEVLAKYKTVADHVTASRLIHYGSVGSSVEVYEKIDPATGKGAISIFGCTPGVYRYKIASSVHESAFIRGDVKLLHENGELYLEADFKDPSAALILFG
jgi:alpha-galactosidase